MWYGSRRGFLGIAGAALVGARFGSALAQQNAQTPGERPRQDEGIEVLNPRMRVPLSFIIDDSTCLVNLAHFAMPQFAAVYPNREDYAKPWKTWPREIPDAFLREFGQWCREHGVKGKYSVVPNPACVGWLDRLLPGWSAKELRDSLKLVRDLMTPNWDIHAEMITHTRVIDIKTGRPFEEVSPATMENSYPQTKKSVDELAAYIAYALRILKNCDLPCEGITTPGGFGGRVKTELSLAVQEAVRDVYGAELPHYFKYVVSSGERSTAPNLEHVRGLDSDDPRATVSVVAGTGDWFCGWDGDSEGEAHRYANQDATEGRMVELIDRGEPAIMLCHWPGMYTNGEKRGFHDLQNVVTAIAARYGDRTIWMKLSEIARYWAAKELTQIQKTGAIASLQAPFASPQFTVRLPSKPNAVPKLTANGEPKPLNEVRGPTQLKPGAWLREEGGVVVCFDLPKGPSTLDLG